MFKNLLAKAQSLVKGGSKEIVKAPSMASGEIQVTEKMIDDYLFGTSTKLIPEQKVMFKQTAMMMNLNPFLKEIYPIPFEEKVYDSNVNAMVSYEPKRYRLSIITGYPAYLKRGERQKDLEYWTVTENGSINLEKPELSDYSATVTIKRKSMSKEFIWKVEFREVAPRGKYKKITLRAMWQTQPKFQCRKCAFAQAFRIYFPEEMGSLPKIREEIESDLINVTPIKKGEPKVEKKKEPEEKKKYRLPDEIFPHTICNLEIYKKNPKQYEDVPLDQILLIRDKAENPEALDGVLSFVIEKGIATGFKFLKYAEGNIMAVVKTATGKEDVVGLSWQDKLKVLRQLQNIAKKKKSESPEEKK